MGYAAKQMILGAEMPPGAIRLIPNLSIAALQHGLAKELAMWYCLRAINHWGSGCLELQMAVEALALHFHYSRSTAYRILSSGDGVFWEKRYVSDTSRPQIKIHGLKRLAKYFAIRCGTHFLEISSQDFVGTASNRVSRQRSWLYASFHKPEGTAAQPISRASIQEAIGVHRRSQQRYDRATVIRVANYACTQDTAGRVTPIFELVDGKCQQWLVHKRLGNTYYCRAQRSGAGMLHRVNTALGQSFKKGEACFCKRFFTTARSYLKCRNRHEDPYIGVRATSRWKIGRMEWCRVEP